VLNRSARLVEKATSDHLRFENWLTLCRPCPCLFSLSPMRIPYPFVPAAQSHGRSLRSRRLILLSTAHGISHKYVDKNARPWKSSKVFATPGSRAIECHSAIEVDEFGCRALGDILMRLLPSAYFKSCPLPPLVQSWIAMQCKVPSEGKEEISSMSAVTLPGVFRRKPETRRPAEVSDSTVHTAV
jgi:hypothetical protein